MGDQITNEDFCVLCGSLLPSKEDVTCVLCDKEVMGIMANGAKMSRSRGVEQCDSNGKILKRFPSISAASRKTGITISSISRVCSGVLGSAGGFAWSYS